MVSSIGTSTAWPIAGAPALQQGRHDSIDHRQADRLVADQGRDKARLAAGRLVERGKTARPLDDVVEGRAVGKGPVLAVAMRGAIDEARVDLAQLFVGEAEPRHRLRAHVVHQNVALPHQRQEGLCRFRLLQIERQRALVAVEVQEHMAHLAVPRRAGIAHDVALGRLDLDHLGAEIAHDLRRQRPEHDRRQIDHLDPSERAGFCVIHHRTLENRPARSGCGSLGH